MHCTWVLQTRKLGKQQKKETTLRTVFFYFPCQILTLKLMGLKVIQGISVSEMIPFTMNNLERSGICTALGLYQTKTIFGILFFFGLEWRFLTIHVRKKGGRFEVFLWIQKIQIYGLFRHSGSTIHSKIFLFSGHWFDLATFLKPWTYKNLWTFCLYCLSLPGHYILLQIATNFHHGNHLTPPVLDFNLEKIERLLVMMISTMIVG